MAYHIHTEIEIGAPAERIWTLLTEIEQYPRWNPFVTRARGKVELGGKLFLQPIVGGRRLSFRAVVCRHEPGRLFAWEGNVIHRWLASGEHVFELEPISSSRTRLIHDEIFRGVAAPIFAPIARGRVIRGFTAMNEAVKAEAEKQAPAGT